jgi:predicted phosphodiesterase
MRIGILSDIHGNMLALKHCLDRLEALVVDRITCLGDVFGYFPDGVQCFDLLQENHTDILMGNHEAFLLGISSCSEANAKVFGLSRDLNSLSKEHRQLLCCLRPTKRVTLDGQTLLLVHGSPWDPLNGYVFPDTFGPLPFFEDIEAVFMGHTHRAHQWKSNGKRAINVGSCGLPRDNGKYSAFCIYDTATREAELYRSEMNIPHVLDHYRDIHPQIVEVLSRRESLDPAWRIV